MDAPALSQVGRTPALTDLSAAINPTARLVLPTDEEVPATMTQGSPPRLRGRSCAPISRAVYGRIRRSVLARWGPVWTDAQLGIATMRGEERGGGRGRGRLRAPESRGSRGCSRAQAQALAAYCCGFYLCSCGGARAPPLSAV